MNTSTSINNKKSGRKPVFWLIISNEPEYPEKSKHEKLR